MSRIIELKHIADYQGVHMVDTDALQEAIERYNADLLPDEDRMTVGEYIGYMKRKGTVPRR